MYEIVGTFFDCIRLHDAYYKMLATKFKLDGDAVHLNVFVVGGTLLQREPERQV